jgi:hypothetical protein
MGYTIHAGRVRLDLFNHRGKWAYSTSLDMEGGYYDDPSPTEAVLRAARERELEGISVTLDAWIADGGIVVCLEPYHKYSYPIMISKDGYRG